LRAALLINLGSISTLVESVSHDPALVLVSGVLSFVAGLAVVRVHNYWAGDWAVLVTIFGWLLLVGGLVRTLFLGDRGPAPRIKIPGPDRATSTVAHDGRVFAVEGEKIQAWTTKTACGY
jgi:hypothetical protein